MNYKGVKEIKINPIKKHIEEGNVDNPKEERKKGLLFCHITNILQLNI